MTFIFIIVLVDTNLEFEVAIKRVIILHVFDSGQIFYTIIIIIYLYIYLRFLGCVVYFRGEILG